MSWKITDEENLNQNQWTSFWRRGFEMENGERGNYFFVKTRGGCSMIIPQLADGRFVMVREYRFLEDKISVEFPGGGIEIDQTPEAAARVELLQEVGYETGSLKLLGHVSPDMGVVVDPTYIFLAQYLTFVGAHKERTEEMTTFFATETEIDAMVRDGKIMNGQTLSSWAIYKAHKI